MSDSSTATIDAPTVTIAPPKKEVAANASGPATKKQPRYNVILWDDQDHTFAYVIKMMQQLFRKSEHDGKLIAHEVNTSGRAICMTTTKELAELKRDQIHAFGGDPLASRGKGGGSMWASIEPMPS
ncbi:MAG: ATP-dependent Clp protease adaptor ClpS [Planctomycetota bacterium]|nr:ATP-dependent Clp protease adaptor ClpS [Planctomycetota bacterium]